MRPFVDPNDRYSYEDWMNEMGAEAGLPNLPPMGHPLQKLGARLGELLDEDHWAECERLLLEGWAHDEIDRKTGQHWRENSELQVWFPMTAEELERLRAENERLKNDAAIYYESAAGLLATNDALRAQLAEAQRDAERWRWLRNHARIFRQSPDMSGNHYWMVQTTTTLRGPTLDAAIDAAMGEPS